MKIRNILFSGVLIAGLFCGCAKKESADVLIQKAEAAAVKGEWSQTLDLSGKAVDAEPKNLRALVLHTLAYENSGKTQEALEEITKAAALYPNSFFAQYTKGRLLYDAGRFESSIAPLKEAHRLRPTSPDALILLADVSVRQKNIPEAQTYYSRLTKLPEYAKDPAPWSEIGMNLLLVNRKPAEAARFFAYAVKLAPSNPSVNLNMAVLYDKYMKKTATARYYYLKYLSLTARDSSLAAKRTAVENRLKQLPAK